MDKRQEDLLKLKSYTEGVDKELTMILQSVQWDRKHLLQHSEMATCAYDSNHKLPPDKSEEHEKGCFLKHNGYTKDDYLLPDPLDSNSSSLIKLSKEDIQQIIANASREDPLFKKGVIRFIEIMYKDPNYRVGCAGVEPLSLERLQISYSADERRAIHDAVVRAVPSCHDLTDLALLSGEDQGEKVKSLSSMDVLAELRNMRRRRTKYRVAAKTRNYSDVLRDVIKSQMEHFNEPSGDIPNETVDERNTYNRTDNNKESDDRHSKRVNREDGRYRYERQRIEVKRERADSTERNANYNRERSGRKYEDKDRSRESYHKNPDRRQHEERRNEKRERNYKEHSRKREHDKDSERDRHKERSRENRHENSKERRYDDQGSRSHREKERDVESRDRSKHTERSKETRHGEKSDKYYKYNENRLKEYKYRDRSKEEVYIKQEREESPASADGYKRREKSKNYDERYNRKRNRDSYSTDRSIKQEPYQRYYGSSSTDEIYDPNKKIKVEK